MQFIASRLLYVQTDIVEMSETLVVRLSLLAIFSWFCYVSLCRVMSCHVSCFRLAGVVPYRHLRNSDCVYWTTTYLYFAFFFLQGELRVKVKTLERKGNETLVRKILFINK